MRHTGCRSDITRVECWSKTLSEGSEGMPSERMPSNGSGALEDDTNNAAQRVQVFRCDVKGHNYMHI